MNYFSRFYFPRTQYEREMRPNEFSYMANYQPSVTWSLGKAPQSGPCPENYLRAPDGTCYNPDDIMKNECSSQNKIYDIETGRCITGEDIPPGFQYAPGVDHYPGGPFPGQTVPGEKKCPSNQFYDIEVGKCRTYDPVPSWMAQSTSAKGGMGGGTLALIAVAGIGAFFLLRKKK